MDKEEKLISIPSGLFGFEGLSRFGLFQAEQEPFLILHSLEEKGLSFILIDPLYFRQDYTFNLSDDDMAELGIENEDFHNVYALAIVTVRPGETPQMTANLQGPIIVNGDTLMARQCISSNPKWQTRHDILAEIKEHQGAGQC
jgi:flagellar assembly factor FliW